MFTSYEVICDHLNQRSATDELLLFTPDPYAGEGVDDLWNSDLDERRESDEDYTIPPHSEWVGEWIDDLF